MTREVIGSADGAAPPGAPPPDGMVPVAADGAAPAGAAAPVLVWTARPEDARATIDALGEGGMTGLAAGSAAGVALRIAEAGCLVVTQEALDARAIDAVGRALVDQPAWSELPIVVLADRVADVFGLRAALEPAWGGAQVTFLTRPVAPLVLMTAVHAALSARMRQFLLRDKFAQETELRRELNHRVKNILATVQAMAKMTERSGGTDAERFDAFQSRLAALASVHAMLFGAPEQASRFELVARAILKPFGVVGEDGGTRVTVSGPGRALRPEAVKTLALVVQELVTNALKYGALSAPEGRVSLDVSERDGRVVLRWRESDGPPVAPPGQRGYGTRYVTTALASLFGEPPELRYEARGFELEVAGPAASLLAD